MSCCSNREMRLLMGLALLGLAAPWTAADGVAGMNPEMPYKETTSKVAVESMPQADAYGFFNGDKKLTFDVSQGFALSMNGRSCGHVIASFRTEGAINSNTKNMTDAKAVMDVASKCFTYTGKIPLSYHSDTEPGEFADFKLTAKLRPDGRIAVDAEYQVAPGARSKIKDDGAVTLFMPLAVVAGHEYLVNGKPGVFPAAVSEDTLVYDGPLDAFTLAPNRPEYALGLENPAKTYSHLALHQNQFELRSTFSGGKLRLILDIRSNAAGAGEVSADTHAGIDFWRSGRLHVPNFSAGRNLLPNPSFEAGLRYFLYTGWGDRITSAQPIHSISDREAKFGKHSLRLHAPRGVGVPGFLHSSAIPVKASGQYTFSYYAKADKPGTGINFVCLTAEWPKFPPMPSDRITTEWRRYSHTLTAPNRGLGVIFSGRYDGADATGANIYVDGMQLEEGGQATPFQDKPVVAQLLTAAGPGNLFDVRAPLRAELVIAARPWQSGKVKLSMEDFFGKVTDWGEIEFKADADGRAKLAVGPERLPGTGVYVVTAAFTLADGGRDTDYFRLAAMEPLANLHKNKNIFGSIMWSGGYNSDAVLARYRALGFGSCTYGPHEKHIFDLYAKYGFTHIDHSIYTIMSREQNPLAEKLKELETVTPEIEKEAEDISYDIARRHPWITNWYFTGESEIFFKLGRMGKYEDIAKLQMACYRGVKRFDPNKKVYIEGGPCNMQPQNGARVYEEYMKCSEGKVKFDGAAIHPYAGTPESPDLDEAAAYFLATLARHGYGAETPVYWNEGVYYSPYDIPEWNLTTTRGFDHYRLYTVSYHMGWSERLAAALVARNFLVALKYHDRVRNFNSWLAWISLDTYMTPMAVQKVPNTLGHLLGDAEFAEDIRFAPDSRGYVFVDAADRPVAAIWSYLPRVDSGAEDSPWAKFKFDAPVEVFDLMENRRDFQLDAEGAFTLPVTPFPMFIRGAAGSRATFCQALKQAKMLGASNVPVQVSARLTGENEMEIQLRNRLSRPLEARLEVNGQTRIFTLGDQAAETFKIAPPERVARDKILVLRLPMKLTVDGVSSDCSVELPCFAVGRRAQDIVIDGDLKDWAAVPAVQLANYMPYPRQVAAASQRGGYPGDFAAQYRALWDEKALYLAVEVKDDKFHHDVAARDRWVNDSLQLFVDTMNDARSRVNTGFDINDYNYDFFPNPDGSVSVLCRYVPDQQLAGGLRAPKRFSFTTEIKAKFRQTPDGYNYEIAIPYYLLLPATLAENAVCGIAFTINDHDGGAWVKGALHSTEGASAHMNPQRYPAMLLAK